MRFLPALALLFFCFSALADDGAKAISGDEIALADGRTLHLAGITAPNAKGALQSLIDNRTLAFEAGDADRYGRIPAQVYAQDAKGKIWLQGELLRQGLAFVYPPAGDEPRLGEMRTLEKKARAMKKGIWADPAYADIPAEKAGKFYGRFAFVGGRVVDAAREKNMVYLNFGADWHTDFTIAIAAHDLRAFARANIDPLTLKGKTIRVRGWIKKNFGPMITVTDPGQIEVLPD